ncbi:unnamed protein product [Didymodactylos carnosus]|uniref:Uncharacterized protein n=1 Tax=Didymodactylos carnosus TaxID=1234261 RepID=A0A816FQ77_9BILA|nr:unnamed protein product [Didymodactylos carnosus]CAF1664346.1 unnamed protein product [Didymodactylos carnosus]CAF4154637.1 unnamed protein product [Didymodactylos carnosus]CAF4620065.1 unnamed protein product [Didymodactylos carnosus]
MMHDYLSKHPLPQRSTLLTAPDDDDWPPGTDTWGITLPSSPSFFEQLNAVIARHQAKRQTVPTPSSRLVHVTRDLADQVFEKIVLE